MDAALHAPLELESLSERRDGKNHMYRKQQPNIERSLNVGDIIKVMRWQGNESNEEVNTKYLGPTSYMYAVAFARTGHLSALH